MKVQAQDGLAVINGDFQQMLSFVKSLPGHRFDGVSKTWSVALLRKDICSTLPGSLKMTWDGMTSFGPNNVYRHDVAQRASAIVVPAFAEMTDAQAKAQQWLREQLRAMMPTATPTIIARFCTIIEACELDSAIADGRIQVTSADRQARLEEIDAEYSRCIDEARWAFVAAEECAYDED